MKKLALIPATVVRMYLEEGTVRKVAKRLKCSIGTVSKYLKLASFNVKENRPKASGRKIPSNHYGSLVKWIKNNPKTPLPVKIKDIVDLTGCSRDQVKSYLYRRRKIIKKQLEDYLKKKPDIFLTDIDNRRFPLKAVKEWRVEFGKDFHFLLYLTLFTDQKKKIILSFKDVQRMLKI